MFVLNLADGIQLLKDTMDLGYLPYVTVINCLWKYSTNWLSIIP